MPVWLRLLTAIAVFLVLVVASAAATVLAARLPWTLPVRMVKAALALFVLPLVVIGLGALLASVGNLAWIEGILIAAGGVITGVVVGYARLPED